MAEGRLVRVFVWKGGAEPSDDYVRQILRVAAPDAVPERDSAPLLVPVVARGVADWPADFWSYALPLMRGPIDWTDHARYELSGWQGTDARSEEKLFVASVYEKPQPVVQPPAFTPGPQQYQAPYTPPQNYAAPNYAPRQQAQPPYAPPSYANPPPHYPQPLTYGAPPQQQAPGGYYGNQPQTPPQQPPPNAPVNYGAPAGGFPAAGSVPTQGGTGGYPQASYNPSQPTIMVPQYALPGHTGISPAQARESNESFYAGFGPRLGAGILDFVIVGILEVIPFLFAVLVLSGVNSGDSNADTQTMLWSCSYACLSLLIAALYFGGFWVARGQTIGMMVTGLRVVDNAGNKPDFGRVMLRLIGYLMSILTFGFGFLMIAFDERRQALHDRIASTFVVPNRTPQMERPSNLPGYAAVGTVPTQPQVAPSYGPPAQTALLPSYETPVISNQQGAPTASLAATMPVVPPTPSFESVPETARTRVDETLSTPSETPSELSETPSEPSVEDATTLFRQGLALLKEGQREVPGGGARAVEPEAAHAALKAFESAAAQNEASGVYRYFIGVAKRYAEGYPAAINDFNAALRADPNNWEARMQLYFGQSWHDAFSYPEWTATERTLPKLLANLQPQRPGAKLTLIREGGGKTVVVLATTRRASWKQEPNEMMPARIQLVPAYSPYGLAIALYVAVRDNAQDPYRTETFLNPTEAPVQGGDATMLGQNLLLQLSRQTHTYLIFVDEAGQIMLNRRLVFDPATQFMLGQAAAQVQAAAASATQTGAWLPLDRFQQAAQWHVERFPLNQVLI